MGPGVAAWEYQQTSASTGKLQHDSKGKRRFPLMRFYRHAGLYLGRSISQPFWMLPLLHR